MSLSQAPGGRHGYEPPSRDAGVARTGRHRDFGRGYTGLSAARSLAKAGASGRRASGAVHALERVEHTNERRDPAPRHDPGFPELAQVAVEFAWGGSVAFTLDLTPHAGRLDSLHYAIGCCAHGVGIASLLGDVMADVLLGRPDRNPLRDLPFRAIPLPDGRLSVERTLKVATEIANALAAAHEKGIVHRDLSPRTSC